MGCTEAMSRNGTAAPGVQLLDATSRDCVRTAMLLYGQILDEIEHADYDVFTRRAAVGAGRKPRISLDPSARLGAVARHRSSAPL